MRASRDFLWVIIQGFLGLDYVRCDTSTWLLVTSTPARTVSSLATVMD